MEKNFAEYLRSQVYRTFSSSIGGIIDHIQTFHTDENIFYSDSWKIIEAEPLTVQYFQKFYNYHKSEVNFTENYIWYHIDRNSYILLDKISKLNILSFHLPSFCILEINHCPKITKKIQKMKESIIFNNLNRIYFKFLSCSEICDQNLAQNYFSSFLFLFDTKSENRNLSKLFYALVATGLEFDYLENFVQIIHNLYPQSYIFDTYE